MNLSVGHTSQDAPVVIDWAERAEKILNNYNAIVSEIREDRSRILSKGGDAHPFPIKSREYENLDDSFQDFCKYLIRPNLNFNDSANRETIAELSDRLDRNWILLADNATKLNANKYFGAVEPFFFQATQLADAIRKAFKNDPKAGFATAKNIAVSPLSKEQLREDAPLIPLEDEIFNTHFNQLDQFLNEYGKPLRASLVAQDAKLLDCVNMAIAVTENYLSGQEMDDIGEAVETIRDARSEIVETGGDITTFPYSYCQEALDFALLIQDRVIKGITPSMELKKEWGYSENAPTTPEPTSVISAIAKLRP